MKLFFARVKNSRYFFHFLCVFTVLLRTYLITGVPKHLRYAPHDDLYFAKMAHFLINGQWMGPYDFMTLIKGPFYAFFMVFSFYTGLPLLLVETIFYILACAFLSYAIYPIIRNRWWGLLFFESLLFCPVSLITGLNMRVYREFVYLSLILYVIAFSIGLFLRIEQKLSTIVIWVMGLGLSMGAFMITREESIWIYPILFMFLATCIISIMVKKIDRKWLRSSIVLSAVLIWYIPMLVISSINYQTYGFWGYSEQLDKDFNRILDNLGRIKTSTWYPYTSITKEGLLKAYGVSPKLFALKGSIESLWGPWITNSDTVMNVKPQWYKDQYFEPGAEIGGTHFSWLLRDALTANGYYSNNRYPREYIHGLADELEHACNTGALDCTSNLQIPLIGAIQKQHIPIILHMFMDYLERYKNYSMLFASLDYRQWGGFQDDFTYFEEIVNNPIDSHNFGNRLSEYSVNGDLDHRIILLHYKEKIMRMILTVYSAVSFPAFVGLSIMLILGLIIPMRKRQLPISFQHLIFFVFILGIFVSRTMTLAIVDTMTVAPGYEYSNVNYLLIDIMLFLLAYQTINIWAPMVKTHKSI